MIDSEELNKINGRLFKEYVGIVLMVLLALCFSYAQGADWRPVIVGVPVYLTFFVASTYQFVKDRRKLGRKERNEPEPLPRKGPWEED